MMNGRDLRIVFMGNPEFSVGVLRALVESGYNVVGVVTNPDKPSGRGQKLNPSAVKTYAQSVGLNVLQPEKLKDDSFIEQLKELNSDLGVVVAFKMLPEVVWSMPKHGTFNVHTSLLPDYRGAAPINWAILNGDTMTGVTTFMLNRDIDTGDIIASRPVMIGEDMNAGELHDKLMEAGALLAVDSIEMVAQGNLTLKSQSEFVGCELRPAPKIFKDDCKLDWRDTLDNLHNKIRGLSPYPAAWCELAGVSFKIFSAHKEPADIEPELIGYALSDGENYLRIAVQGGYLYIDELQAAGKKRVNIKDYLRGNKTLFM